jgi:hypothetical protein
MRTHASILAIRALLGLPDTFFPSAIQACDWDEAIDPHGYFGDTAALALLQGSPGALPDCPACALLVDMALEIRAETEAARVNAELNAEKEKAA